MKTFLILVPACICMHMSLHAQTDWHIAGNSGTNASSNFIGTTDNVALRIRTNNAVRMSISSSGRVGIGTTSPQSKFHVNGTGTIAVFGTGTTSSTNNYWYTGNDVGSYIEQTGNTTTASSDRLRIQSSKNGNFVDYSILNIDPTNGFSFITSNGGNGNVGIGTTSPAPYKLKIFEGLGTNYGLDFEQVNGNDWEILSNDDFQLYYNTNLLGEFNNINGGYSVISDERRKTNIRPMAPALHKIIQLKPLTFQFKNITDTQWYDGFIAQDVMKIFPSLVSHILIPERNVDVYTLNYSGFGVLAIKGVQELQTIVEQQQKGIEELKKSNDDLKKQIDELKKVIESKQMISAK